MLSTDAKREDEAKEYELFYIACIVLVLLIEIAGGVCMHVLIHLFCRSESWIVALAKNRVSCGRIDVP